MYKHMNAAIVNMTDTLALDLLMFAMSLVHSIYSINQKSIGINLQVFGSWQGAICFFDTVFNLATGWKS